MHCLFRAYCYSSLTGAGNIYRLAHAWYTEPSHYILHGHMLLKIRIDMPGYNGHTHLHNLSIYPRQGRKVKTSKFASLVLVLLSFPLRELIFPPSRFEYY
jgi:hypothetical protein